MPDDLIRWILAGRTLAERLQRIETALAHEGYALPPLPRGVDLSEAGEIHWLRGEPYTVRYAVVDQGGRKVYHYREREVDHIMVHRFRKGDEWALEYLAAIPHILQGGRVISIEAERVVYHSRRRYLNPETGDRVPLRVIIRLSSAGRWYVATFYPWYRGGR